MYFIIGHDPARYFHVRPEFYETFIRFDFTLSRDGSDKSDGILLHATVPFTDDFEADKSAALEMIAEQFLRISHDYWDGQCATDEDIDEGLKYEAAREDALRMEHEIAVKFVDALALDGYTVARDMIGNDFRLADAGERAEFKDYVFDGLIGDITVFRTGAAHRFSFNFGRDGWDIVRSSNGRLETMIETITEPYRVKGHDAKIDGKHPSGAFSRFLDEISTPRQTPT